MSQETGKPEPGKIKLQVAIRLQGPAIVAIMEPGGHLVAMMDASVATSAPKTFEAFKVLVRSIMTEIAVELSGKEPEITESKPPAGKGEAEAVFAGMDLTGGPLH